MTAAAPRKVVIAYDDSASGRDALALGEVLAEVLAATPIAVAVVEVAARLVPPEDLAAFLDSNAGPLLQVATDELGANASARAVAGESAARALHELVEAERPLAVVVGSTNRGHLGRVFPGTTAASLLHGAPCAVAVAPRGYAEADSRHLLRLGVAVDPGEESTWALRAAIFLAERLHGSIRLLAVKQPLHSAYLGTYPGIAISDYEEAVRRETEETLAAAAEHIPEGVSFEKQALEGDPAARLVDASRGLDLLVMGSRSYGLPKSTLLGSVSRRVLGDAACPVLVLPRAAGSNPLGFPSEQPIR